MTSWMTVPVVPKAMHGCTLVAIKATAGLCLLPGSQSTDILKVVEGRIHSSYPFQLQEEDGVVIRSVQYPFLGTNKNKNKFDGIRTVPAVAKLSNTVMQCLSVNL